MSGGILVTRGQWSAYEDCTRDEIQTGLTRIRVIHPTLFGANTVAEYLPDRDKPKDREPLRLADYGFHTQQPQEPTL